MKFISTFFRSSVPELVAIRFVCLVIAAIVAVCVFDPFLGGGSTLEIASPVVRELSRLKELDVMCGEYAGDNEGKFPARLEDLYPQYVTDQKLYKSELPENSTGGVKYTPGITESSPADAVVISERLRKSFWVPEQEIQVHVDDSARIVRVP